MRSYCGTFNTTYNIDGWILLKTISSGSQGKITKTMVMSSCALHLAVFEPILGGEPVEFEE